MSPCQWTHFTNRSLFGLNTLPEYLSTLLSIEFPGEWRFVNSSTHTKRRASHRCLLNTTSTTISPTGGRNWGPAKSLFLRLEPHCLVRLSPLSSLPFILDVSLRCSRGEGETLCVSRTFLLTQLGFFYLSSRRLSESSHLYTHTHVTEAKPTTQDKERQFSQQTRDRSRKVSGERMSHKIALYFTASLGSFTTDRNQAREEARHTNPQFASDSPGCCHQHCPSFFGHVLIGL